MRSFLHTIDLWVKIDYGLSSFFQFLMFNLQRAHLGLPWGPLDSCVLFMVAFSLVVCIGYVSCISTFGTIY